MEHVTQSYIDKIAKEKGINYYRKKPIEVQAFQIDTDFYVDTLEGRMEGNAGDYVIKGIQGELYIIRNDIFHQTYDLVSENKN